MEHEQSSGHTRHDHLTAVLGYAQLLQRRIALCPNLTPSERAVLQEEAAAIVQAAYALQRDLASPSLPDDATHQPPDLS